MKDYFIIAFYKAKLGDGKYVDDGISIYTTAVNAIAFICLLRFKMAWKVIRNRYSHVEVWWPIPDIPMIIGVDYTIEAGGGSDVFYGGKMLTSTMRQGMAGTVIRDAYGVFLHPERWDIMKIEVDELDLKVAKSWAQWQAENNMGYNKKTIGNFFNPFRPTQKPRINEKHICSVIVQGFCWTAGLFLNWSIWSPIKLWTKLTKLGYKTEHLVKK